VQAFEETVFAPDHAAVEGWRGSAAPAGSL
jgi:hypothetical protein